MKRPDLSFDMGTRVILIEVDEAYHENIACWDEDSRLEVIAADFQKPISVLRLSVDTPESCFVRKHRCNGEPIWEAREPAFGTLMARTEEELRRMSMDTNSADDAVHVVTVDGAAQE